MKIRFPLVALVPAILGCATMKADSFSTDFESYTPGNVVGTNGWAALSNSPVSGSVVATPFPGPVGVGAQVLQLSRVGINTGVNSGLNSPLIAGAGESGTLNGGIDVLGLNQFTASLWFATPSTPIVNIAPSSSAFLQFNPSTKNSIANPLTDTASRYGIVSLSNPDNTADGRLQIYSSSASSAVTSLDLVWGQWYRLEYTIDFADGLNGTLANDTLTVAVFDATNALVGTLASFTWETNSEYRNGGYGGGTGPRQINGFDFLSRGGENTVVGYVGSISYSSQAVPEPSIGMLVVAGCLVLGIRRRRGV